METRGRQLALDLGEHQIWTSLPKENRRESRERLARMLLRIVAAERSGEEAGDDRD